MKNIKQLADNVYAHRGFFDNKFIPENSVEAFKKAIKYGYNIELDVHITKDNKVVVFHDHNLLRLCGVNKVIEYCTYEEICNFYLLNTKYKIPLLSDVLEIINGKVNILIETKVNKFNGKLEKELAKLLDNYKGCFAIQSFNLLSIIWFKRHRKNYIIGVLASNFKRKKTDFLYRIINKNLLFDRIIKVDFISYDIRSIPNKYIIKRRKDRLIFGWTFKHIGDLNDKDKYFDTIIAESEILFKK